MPIMTFQEQMLANLEQKLPTNHPAYRSKEQAYHSLKLLTEVDFGYDIEAWKQWFEENWKDFYKGIKPF